MPQPPAFLPGPSIEELTTELDDSPRRNTFMTMRGAVLALDPPEDTAVVSHPTTGDTSVPQTFTALPATFSLRGELMHSFISYRVATEVGDPHGAAIGMHMAGRGTWRWYARMGGRELR